MNMTWESYLEMVQQHIILYMRDYQNGIYRSDKEFRGALDNDFLLMPLDTGTIANTIIHKVRRGDREPRRKVS